MKRLTLILLALASLGLAACEKKDRVVSSAAFDEKAYCEAHPHECVMSTGVRP